LAVRVRVRLRRKHGGSSKEFVVLVNSGAESEEPVIVVYPDIVEDLGLSLSRDFDLVEVELASGKTHNLISKEKLILELIDEKGNVLASTKAYVAVDENLTEPLITDATIDELGIQVISFKKGLWRHRKDPINMVRSSAMKP